MCDPETGSLLYVGDVRLESRAIMVNKEGDRFVEELDRRDVLSNAIVEQTDGKAYMLFNQANATRPVCWSRTRTSTRTLRRARSS